MNSNYILLNYQVNWSDLQTNFLASLKYPVQPWLFDTGSRPPSWGGSFPWCKGGMVTGDAGGFTLGTHSGSLRACPQPRQLPALCSSGCWGVEHMGFSHLTAPPCLGFSSYTRLLFLDYFKRNLPPGSFLSADTAPAQRWKFPLRR